MMETSTVGMELTPKLRAKIAANSIRVSNGCIEWAGYNDRQGYAKVYVPGIQRQRKVARLMLLDADPDDNGLDVLHRCGNAGCINTEHLYWGDDRQNTVDAIRHGTHSAGAINASKTHCVNGHEFTPENTKLDRSGTSIKRQCRECRRLHKRAAYHAQSAISR